MNEKDQTWAVFWCSLLRPILFEEIHPSRTNSFLKQLAQKKVRFPNGQLRKPSLATLKRKLKRYRSGGFEALARKTRADRGKPRAVSPAVIEAAVKIKKDQPKRSDETINRFLNQQHRTTVKRSTLYRHLKAAGATRIKLGVGKEPVRKRWTREHTHALWVGDFEEGPFVLHNGEILLTHLSAFIDCHSRFLVEGRYYLRQNLDILIDSFIRGLTTHGTPLAIYVDNAKVYHAKALKAACISMNIEPLYRRPRDPAGGGLIERFFQTAQSQFEAEIRAGDLLTLERLNRAFSAWLHVSYHDRIHSEIGQTPQQRYQQGLKVIRHVDLERALTFFLRREKRKVDRVFADVRLSGHCYRVDKRLRGDWVLVLYDPFSNMETVRIHSLEDVYLGQGRLHRREAGEPADVPKQGKPQYNYTELLIRQHEAQLAAQAQGIDYRKLRAMPEWPFTAFAQSFARLLGKKGGLGGFSTGELETLKAVYNRNRSVSEALLKQAFALAALKTVTHVAYELQILIQRKEPPSCSSSTSK